MEMSMVAFYRDLDGELDYRLPGDGTADGGFHNWTNDSGNGYDTENNDGYRNQKYKQQEEIEKMDILQVITQELGVQKWQVEAAVKLIDEGNTIPFISR